MERAKLAFGRAEMSGDAALERFGDFVWRLFLEAMRGYVSEQVRAEREQSFGNMGRRKGGQSWSPSDQDGEPEGPTRECVHMSQKRRGPQQRDTTRRGRRDDGHFSRIDSTRSRQVPSEGSRELAGGSSGNGVDGVVWSRLIAVLAGVSVVVCEHGHTSVEFGRASGGGWRG